MTVDWQAVLNGREGLVTGQYTTTSHTHPFNGPFSRTTQVSRYQKGKTNLDFTEARDSKVTCSETLGSLDMRSVRYASGQTDRHTDRPAHCNTPLTYRRRYNN